MKKKFEKLKKKNVSQNLVAHQREITKYIVQELVIWNCFVLWQKTRKKLWNLPLENVCLCYLWDMKI